MNAPTACSPSISPLHAEPLRRYERIGLVLVGLVWLAFGVVVEIRSEFQRERKTDLGVYTRAAWAVRAGIDPYSVAEERGWHYCYPPLLAVVAAPLAEPPADHPDRQSGRYLPFAVTVAIWYLLSLAAVYWSIHILANAVLPNEVRFSRRWWYARTMPAYLLIGSIGMTLSRGQVNTFVIALTSIAFVASIRGHLFRAGVAIALAASIKVIPLVLAAYPVARQQWRSVVGGTAGLLLGLLLIPAVGLGITGAIDGNRSMLELVIRPGTTGGGDQTRAKELTDTVSTDSQSFAAMLHVWRYPDPLTRPRSAEADIRLAHALLSLLMLAVTMVMAWRSRRHAADLLIVFGAFHAVMLLASPVSHMHYYLFALPLVAGLWFDGMQRHPGLGACFSRMMGVMAIWGLATALPLFPWPWAVLLRDFGAGTLATVGLWGCGLWRVAKNRSQSMPAAGSSLSYRRRAWLRLTIPRAVN